MKGFQKMKDGSEKVTTHLKLLYFSKQLSLYSTDLYNILEKVGVYNHNENNSKSKSAYLIVVSTAIITITAGITVPPCCHGNAATENL